MICNNDDGYYDGNNGGDCDYNEVDDDDGVDDSGGDFILMTRSQFHVVDVIR